MKDGSQKKEFKIAQTRLTPKLGAKNISRLIVGIARGEEK